eukprot:GEMP01036497.1.p1 GENE.GEMP01036497.1~~GEMP01036497.1.p1  ORF type:complete len:512 (+),score=170.54 GEMP01036497.1:29-1537(+)
MGLGADRVIRERQKYEARYEALVASNIDQMKVERKAQWENKCGTLERTNAIKRKVTDVMQARADSLMERRQKLGMLLAMEQKQYEQETVETEETPQERLEKTATRALELKKKREDKRQQVVQEKMYQQWREGVDELRQADSKLFELEVLAARDDQVYEKALRKDVEAAEAEHWGKLWHAGYLAKVERETKEEELKRHRNKEMTNILGFQTNMKNDGRVEDKSKVIAEEEQMKMLWAQQKQEAEAEAARRVAAAKKERVKIDEYAAIQKEIKDEAIAKDKEIDKDYIMGFLAQSKEACALDARMRLERKEESVAFAAKLKVEMAQRTGEEEEREIRLRQENEAQWEKREVHWGREAAARQELLEETYVGREEQVKLKDAHRSRAMELVLEDRIRADGEVARLDGLEDERLDAEALVKKRHQEELFRQMDFHQVQRMREMQQFKIEQRQGAVQEQKFQRAITQEKQKIGALSTDIFQTRVSRAEEREKVEAEKLKTRCVAPWEK